ncbi:hypothetical protein A0H81_13791 [Grifola frondosa]|uniref:Uncharacterized protein n=1 Tax=Grifola frondosa TaxID=5627 RepID=A0A1C7LPW5_GRIFR|nr:hypothetical protein A0H81_13791 [Grifola frondosa]
MWGEVQLQRGEERERELSSKSIFFLDALDHGARMLRHHNTVESARAIMRVTLANIPETLQMQHELVTENKTVVETEVGIDVYNGLRRQEQTHQANMKDIYGEMRSMREALVGGIGREAHRKEVEELRNIVTNLAKKVAEIDEERKKLAEENNQQKETIKRLMEVISRQEQENKSSRQRREKQGNTPKKTDRAMETQTKTPEIRVHTIRVVAEERPSMERTPENKKDDSWVA